MKSFGSSRGRLLVAVGALTLVALGMRSLWAFDYTVVFGNTTNLAGQLTLGSPHGGTTYRAVVSKFNQPRAVNGTNPHRGTDLSSAYGTPVYALWNGWIVAARPCGQTNGCELDTYLDLNNDGLRNDNAHLRYDHLSSIRYTTANRAITKGEWIADSGDEQGVYAAHLHFGLRKDTGSDGVSDVWIRNEPYYRSVTAWDVGRLLDFVSLSTFAGNVGSVHCYAADENSQNEAVAAGDVVFYHRRTGTSSWTASTAAKSSNQFTLNFTGRYAAGTSIQWMVKCNRTSKIGVAYPYWAYHPPKYNQPTDAPNSVVNAFDFFTNTVQ